MDIAERIRVAISSVVTYLTMPCMGEVTFERVHDLLVEEMRPPKGGGIPEAMVQVALSEIRKIEAARAVPEPISNGKSTRPYTDRPMRVWTPAAAHALHQQRQCG